MECCVCRKEFEGREDDPEPACPTCSLELPPSLLKACGDPFAYALGLKSGTVIEFCEARITGRWVKLEGVMTGGECPFDKLIFGHRFYRGLEVRLEDIAWCADAPDGS